MNTKNAPVQDPALRKRWKVMVTFRPINSNLRGFTYTVALTDCASRKYFEHSKHFEKECQYKVTYIKLSFFGKSREPGYRYRYYGKSIDLDPVISP